jgi:hypothetical protein
MPSTDLASILGSDILLGCVFLLAIALASLKLLPVSLIPERNGAALGISTAAKAYKSYGKASKSSARKMRTSFHAGLRKAGNTKRIANEIGYADKLEKLERAVEVNSVITNGIYTLATEANGADASGKGLSLRFVPDDPYVGTDEHAKVREALKHFVRDWSEEGRKERHQAFRLVLDALEKLEREVSGRRAKRVLVPGAGLGRLAWEISQLGSFALRLSAFKRNVDFPQDSTRQRTSVRTS